MFINNKLKYIAISLIAVSITIIFGVYVSKLLFSTNSLEVYLSLKDKKKHLADQIIKYKIENSKLQKDYFEKEGIDYREVFSLSGNILTKLINLIYLFDYASIYKAISMEVDPTPVKAIDFVKERL